ACTIARRKIDQYKEHCSALLEHLENQISKKIPDVTINGANEPRVSNTLNVSFTGLDAGLIATRLDMAGIEVSVGSACSSGRNSSSRVLEAMGLSRHESLGAIRFSLGWDNDAAMIDETVSKLAEIVETLRRADQAANVIKF
ncbi:MAG: aminotransferase class V-fold PLP-dependent enzyme, partial [Victivallaceae bacterium]|nr:aminotransferase class V-fold PLP-dependent enzyme [Victivallaceae bacterium]